jgi:hypothetical protein
LMGARGRARITGRYELATVIQMHERLYRDLLRERSTAIRRIMGTTRATS